MIICYLEINVLSKCIKYDAQSTKPVVPEMDVYILILN